MEVDLASQPGMVGSLPPAHQQDSRLDRHAGFPQTDIQPALVVDILAARVPLLLAKVPAAKSHQDQLAAPSFQMVTLAASCLLFPTAVARAEAAPESIVTNCHQVIFR